MTWRWFTWKCAGTASIFAAGLVVGALVTRREEPSRASADRPIALPEEAEIEQAWAVVYNPFFLGGRAVPLFEVPKHEIPTILGRLKPYVRDDDEAWNFCGITGETGMVHFELSNHHQLVMHWYNVGHNPLHFTVNGRFYRRLSPPAMRDHALELQWQIARIYEASQLTGKSPERIADPWELPGTAKP